MREEVRNVQARLPVFLERSPGCEKYGLPELCILKIGIAEAFRWMLAVQLPQQRLRIEGVHVAGAALHEQRDDALRRCRLWWFPRRQGICSEWFGHRILIQHAQGG